MNKTELLQALSSKFYRVETPTEQQDYGNLKYYLVKVYDLVGDGLRDSNIAFYVENEGQGNEAAYWSPAEPKPDSPIATFQQEINTYISAKVADSTIEAAFPELVDISNEVAVYHVVMPNLTEKRLFVDKDVNGDLQHRLIV
jgi:hypothetical protein